MIDFSWCIFLYFFIGIIEPPLRYSMAGIMFISIVFFMILKGRIPKNVRFTLAEID